jgi:hypothetical protein
MTPRQMTGYQRPRGSRRRHVLVAARAVAGALVQAGMGWNESGGVLEPMRALD